MKSPPVAAAPDKPQAPDGWKAVDYAVVGTLGGLVLGGISLLYWWAHRGPPRRVRVPQVRAELVRGSELTRRVRISRSGEPDLELMLRVRHDLGQQAPLGLAAGEERLVDLLRLDQRTWGVRANEPLARSAALARFYRRARRMPSLWLAAVRHVGDALAPALRLPLKEVLAESWNRYRELPEGPEDVPLYKHTIEWSAAPVVTVLVDGKPRADVHFTAKVEVEVEVATLHVRAGRIASVSTGAHAGTIALFCEGFLVAKHAYERELPGTLRFDDGLPPARPDRDRFPSSPESPA